MNSSVVYHTLEPIYDNKSEILILGSIPSMKSKEIGFYYMHPKNRFWKVLENVYGISIGESIEDKKSFLINNKIALWDVIKKCDIVASKDDTIKNVTVNDINMLIKNSNIKKIFLTGKKAYELYYKYLYDLTKIEGIYLSSPSNANCKVSLEELVKEYKKIII